LPQFAAIGGLDAQKHQVISIGTGEKDPILPYDGGRARLPGQFAAPLDVLRLAPFRRQILFRGDTIAARASPLRPRIRERWNGDGESQKERGGEAFHDTTKALKGTNELANRVR